MKCKGNAAIIIPAIIIANVIEFSGLRIVEVDTNPPVVNVVKANDIESRIFICPKIYINKTKIVVYTTKIILIVESTFTVIYYTYLFIIGINILHF